MRTLYKILLILLLAALCVVGFLWWKASQAESTAHDIEPARIVDIRPVVKLCTVEINEDIPVKGKIGTKHIFARQTLTGTISFDLESIKEQWRGDTLIVHLPKERVEVYESTAPGSYKVIDTWNDQLFGSSNFSTAEENQVKEQARHEFISRLYGRGIIDQARKNAVDRLRAMLPPLTGGSPVLVLDTLPPSLLRTPAP